MLGCLHLILSRYWGTPIPIWVSEDGEETVCIGSVEELYQLSGVRLTDLHREFVVKVRQAVEFASKKFCPELPLTCIVSGDMYRSSRHASRRQEHRGGGAG